VLDRRRALALGAGLAAAGAGPASAQVEEAVGEIASMSGSVLVLRGQGFTALGPGSAIFAADILRTGPDGKVLILCRDGLRLAIGSGTEVAVRTYLVDAPSGALQVALGLLRGIVRLIGGDSLRRQWIEVDTRTAVASVRSTEWLVESTPKGTGVLSLVGAVEVVGLAGGRVLLQPGEGTDVPPGRPPNPPARWGAPRRLDAIARTTL
jgi:hypothetical protein